MELPPEDSSARGLVWLITFAAVLPDTADQAAVPLRILDAVTRENVRDAVLDAVENPAREGSALGGRPPTAPTTAVKLVVFQEELRGRWPRTAAGDGRPGGASDT